MDEGRCGHEERLEGDAVIDHSLFSKPCGRVGCPDLITAKSQRALAKREFCSTRCAVRQRIATGRWHYPTPTPEQRRAGGRNGGRRSADTRRMKAMQAQATRLADLVPPRMIGALGPDDSKRLLVLLVHAWRRGYRTGYQTATHRRARRAA